MPRVGGGCGAARCRSLAKTITWRTVVLAAWLALLLPALPLRGVAGNEIDPEAGHSLHDEPIHDVEGDGGARHHRYELTNATPPAQRCTSTLGGWCHNFHKQTPILWRPAPRGNKACPGDCNGVGNCNYDIGYCDCPAGWKGEDCKTVQKRPCTNSRRAAGNPSEEPLSHIDENGRDLDLLVAGGDHSRCAGICDDDVAMCYCDGDMGRIPAPKGAPPGTPPIRKGRPMVTMQNQPGFTKDGKKISWGEQPWERMFGPKGWCNAKDTDVSLPCIIDGVAGPRCDIEIEHFCVNQCSGHGDCDLGFCKCHKGWYGHDCSRKRAALSIEPSRIASHGWLARTAAEPPAAADPPPKSTRPRPLIYVYDLEPLYSQKLLQYRIPSSWCIHRRYDEHNNTIFTDLWVYAVDTLLHESILQSEHRTFDPEEADFFYVPQYGTCYIYPIHGWGADYPWFPAPGGGLRWPGAAYIALQTKRWVQEHHPYWDRKGGKDHIFLFTHDEGACWAPTELSPATWLVHWGRLGKNHSSNTAFGGDNYNEDYVDPLRMPDGYRQLFLSADGNPAHPCYDPEKVWPGGEV